MSRRRQQGFSLVAAIFVLVVLAALAAYMVTIGTAQRATASYAVQGARAYQAAQAGVEWGMHQAWNNPAATCGNAPATPTTNNFGLSAPGLSGFTVTVTCSYSEHPEGPPPPVRVYLIQATASSGTFGQPDYFSRTIVSTVTNAP